MAARVFRAFPSDVSEMRARSTCVFCIFFFHPENSRLRVVPFTKISQLIMWSRKYTVVGTLSRWGRMRINDVDKSKSRRPKTMFYFIRLDVIRSDRKSKLGTENFPIRNLNVYIYILRIRIYIECLKYIFIYFC